VATVDRPFYRRGLTGDGDLLEWITVILLVPAVVFGAKCWFGRRELGRPWIARWWLMLTLSCIYFGGEDINWG